MIEVNEDVGLPKAEELDLEAASKLLHEEKGVIAFNGKYYEKLVSSCLQRNLEIKGNTPNLKLRWLACADIVKNKDLKFSELKQKKKEIRKALDGLIPYRLKTKYKRMRNKIIEELTLVREYLIKICKAKKKGEDVKYQKTYEEAVKYIIEHDIVDNQTEIQMYLLYILSGEITYRMIRDYYNIEKIEEYFSKKREEYKDKCCDGVCDAKINFLEDSDMDFNIDNLKRLHPKIEKSLNVVTAN